MEVISPQIKKELAGVAKDLGISEEAALQEVVSSYRLRTASSDLRSELQAWEATSVADFSAFEKTI